MKKGFTLIELLVVIAIISLLSSVVLASLSAARGKAANASVRANLASARAEAAIFFDTNNTFVGVCDEDSNPLPNTIGRFVRAALTVGGDPAVLATHRCHGDASGWVALSRLKVAEGVNNFYCIDSEGKSRAFEGTNGSNLYLLNGLVDGERC